jgi:hypothetical protein
MLHDWTNAWLEEAEDTLLSDQQKNHYYQSIYQDWYDTKTEERYQTERQTQTEREDWDELDWNGT